MLSSLWLKNSRSVSVTGQKRRPWSLITSVYGSYRNIRLSFKIQNTVFLTERRLLGLAFLCVLVLFLSRIPKLIVIWHDNSLNEAIPSLIGIYAFASIFFAPLVLYLFAAVCRLVSKFFHGQGSFRSSRLAVFWGIIISAPFLLTNGIVQGYLYGTSIAVIVDFLTGALFAWIIASTIAESENFVSPLPLFLITTGATAYLTFMN